MSNTCRRKALTSGWAPAPRRTEQTEREADAAIQLDAGNAAQRRAHAAQLLLCVLLGGLKLQQLLVQRAHAALGASQTRLQT